MPEEGQLSILEVILGAYGQQDPTVFQVQHIPLQAQVRLAFWTARPDANTVQTVFANHTMPERVVQVCDKHFT